MMITDKRIEMVHMQITRNCNLRCYFCGQWGRKGFFSDDKGTQMQLDDWKKVISELLFYREKTGISPFVMLWGGEPLVSPYFDVLAELLYKNDFSVGIVSNGVLLDRHKEAVEKYVKKLYVSVDGTKELHDAIRGEGVFDRVYENLKSLKHNNITVMSVITDKLLDSLPEFLDTLDKLPIKEVYLQDMIGLSTDETEDYKKWMRESFNINAAYIDSWRNDENINIKERPQAIFTSIDRTYHYTITHKEHGREDIPHCMSPFRHIHITWNGNAVYCTDFYDFSAGNVKENGVEEIFNNELSESFRNDICLNKCHTCRHCSWRNQTNYSE